MDLDSRNWDARYGHDLLAAYGPTYDSYIAITSPSAWALTERFFPNPPRQLEFQRGMAEGYLEPLVDRLPEADVVLAIGGGNALDVGKYVAWKAEKPLVMVPTIVSTGAIFQAPFAVRRTNIWEFVYETVAPDYLLLDYGVIAAAPPHLNRAGMGECICNMGAVGSWRWWVDQGLDAVPWDQDAADATLAWVRERAKQFSEGLDADGYPNDAAIYIASEINRERYDVPTYGMQVSHGIDHTFVIAFEWIHGRELIHSEAVSLGSLINAHVYEWGFDETKSLLDACRVRYRPSEIGCSWDEVKTVIDRINELNDRLGDARNWFHHRKLDGDSFDSMVAAVDAR